MYRFLATAGTNQGLARRPQRYRGTSLIRNTPLLRPYSRNMPRALWRPYGGGLFLMSEVLLYTWPVLKLSRWKLTTPPVPRQKLLSVRRQTPVPRQKLPELSRAKSCQNRKGCRASHASPPKELWRADLASCRSAPKSCRLATWRSESCRPAQSCQTAPKCCLGCVSPKCPCGCHVPFGLLVDSILRAYTPLC